MENDNKIPAIRFKGFYGPWEQCKLGDLGSVAMNRRIFKEQTSEMGDIPFYKIGTFGGKPDAYISRELFEEYKKKYPYPEVGDILISASGSIGRTVEYTGKDEYFQDSNIVWLKHNGKINNSFLKQFYKIVRWEGIEGSTIQRLYNKNILETKISIPSLREQKQIGRFFQHLDHLITLHQHKLEKLKIIKNSMLENFFPEGEKNKPNIRFEAFNDTWEQRKLGKLGNTFTGLSGKTKEDFGHGDAKFITYMNVFRNPVADFYGTECVKIDDKQNQVRFGDVFFTTSSETPEEVGMSSVWLDNTKNIYLNSFCFGYRPTEKIDPYYLAFMLRSPSIRKNFIFLAQGISRYNISKNKVMEMKVPIPEIAEQERVGEFFRQMNHLITLHQCKLEKLEIMKKSMLEKMFVD